MAKIITKQDIEELIDNVFVYIIDCEKLIPLNTDDTQNLSIYKLTKKILDHAYELKILISSDDSELIGQHERDSQYKILKSLSRIIIDAPKIFEFGNREDILKMVQVLYKYACYNLLQEHDHLITILETIADNTYHSSLKLENIKHLAKFIKILPHKYEVMTKNFTSSHEVLYKILYTSGVIECPDYDLLNQIFRPLENILCGPQNDYYEAKARKQFQNTIKNFKNDYGCSLNFSDKLSIKEVKERLISTLKHSFNYSSCSKMYNFHKTTQAVKELISFISPNTVVIKQIDNKVPSLRDLATFEYIKYLNITNEKIDETKVPAELRDYIKIVRQTTISTLEMTPESINEPEMSSDEILSAFDLLVPVNNALYYWHKFLSGEVA